MREIKFRAWNKRIGWKNKDFSNCDPSMEYEGWVIYPDSGICNFPESGGDISGGNESPENFILMQYTGLKDKYGVEIYEGDVLKGVNSDITADVFFRDGSYHLRLNENQGSNNLIQMRCKYYEVIGNIYQNPELVATHT